MWPWRQEWHWYNCFLSTLRLFVAIHHSTIAPQHITVLKACHRPDHPASCKKPLFVTGIPPPEPKIAWTQGEKKKSKIYTWLSPKWTVLILFRRASRMNYIRLFQTHFTHKPPRPFDKRKVFQATYGAWDPVTWVMLLPAYWMSL